MKRIIYLGIIVTLVTFSSCQKKSDIGGTNAQKMANEWWVQLFDPSGALVWPAANNRSHIATYNTSANSGEIWVDDQGEVWDFKVKANANLDHVQC
jgi:hypothetical protein